MKIVVRTNKNREFRIAALQTWKSGRCAANMAV